MMFGKKPTRCYICGDKLDDNCGLKFKMRVKRYSPEGWWSVLPHRGLICEECLKTAKEIIAEKRGVSA